MLLELNDAETTAAEVDDRRYVLQISHHSIKRYKLHMEQRLATCFIPSSYDVA